MTRPEWPMLNVSGYVLAGGRSSRMCQDKALLAIDGEALVEHALRKLRPICAQTRILSGPPNFDRDALLSCYAHLIPDADAAHAGPLAALAAALEDCPTTHALLLAVDQPAMSTETLTRLAQAGTRRSTAAACFISEGKPETLPLLVARDLRPGIRRALQAGERRLLPTVQACAAELGREMLLVEPGEVSGDSFTNLNTPEDLYRWRKAALSNQSVARASETSDG